MPFAHMYIQMFKREEIKNIRESLGMTQDEFARRIGVTVTTVSRWERGDSLPKSKVVIDKIKRLKNLVD
ncbi:MAG: helix-turn-helix domain-containing protein [Nitrospinae bacterium]|nr:helix-turn-helix domain-containing protein [Nitrospinota bacterium]